MSENIKLGSKVDIIGKGLSGVVAYIGSTSFASGKWIGVSLNKPLGKNDGEVQGKRYFTCDPLHGVFVRPTQIQVLESPSLLRKSGDERRSTNTSSLPAPNRVERSSSPSRQSRLLPPSSMQKPKSRLSFAPKQRSSLTTEQSTVDEEKNRSASESTSKIVDTPPAKQPDPDPVSVDTALPTPPVFAPGVSMVEIESLKNQVKEWKEKFETIRIKRQEDRAKLKDFEKMKIQIQHLQDGKARSSDQIQELSKQLREAKKAKDEAIEAKERYMDEMSDVHETVEMATLDKEMAEEKADVLQKEVETLNEKVEELQTDLEILKAEIEDEGTEGAATNFQIKQLTEQNLKLKEALVKLRDLLSAEKTEYQSLEKQFDKKSKELNEITAKKEKLETELEMTQSTLDELKEQVDASMAAEEMIETLTEKNLDQEEKIVDLEEQIHDLESINEMNEELQENARETELELREEVDLMRAKMLEAKRQAEAANEVVSDYQDTIQKFRKVVQDLQDANQELRLAQSEQEEKSDAESIASQPPSFNYQIKMVETKAAARSIDHELRKLDLSQSNMLTHYLRMYLPKSIEKGGDNDCIEVLLLVKRLSSKAEIIAKHVTDKFDLNADVSKGVELLGVRGDQLTFGNSLVHKLTNLQVLMESYSEALNRCPVELLLKIGTLYREMLSYEQVLNVFTDLLRKDILDETTNTDALDKMVQFFLHLYNVHLSSQEFQCHSILDRYLYEFQAIFDALSTNTLRLKEFLQPGNETSDVAILLKDLTSSCGDMKQTSKKIRRRMPQPPIESKINNFFFSKEVQKRLKMNLKDIGLVHNFIHGWVRLCTKVNQPTDASTLMMTKMLELLKQSAVEVYESQDVFSLVRSSIGDVLKSLNEFLTALQEGDYDVSLPIAEIQSPIEKRSQSLKSEMVDSEGLNMKLEEKDSAILELRKIVKLKNEDSSEAKIRIGMLERKLEKAVKEGNEKNSLLQQNLDSITEDLKKKEKEYEETYDALQSDIDQLEAEKAELKLRLSSQAKRHVLTDIGFKSPSLGASNAGLKSESISGPAKVVDSPLLLQQINVLRATLRMKNAELSKLQGEKMIRDLKNLTPLNNLKPKVETDEIKDVRSKLKKLSFELSNMMIPKVIDISKRKPGRYPVGSGSPYQTLLQREWKLQVMNEELKNLSLKTQQSVALSKELVVKSDFTTFPVAPLAKSLSLGEPQLVGKLQLHRKGASNRLSMGLIDQDSGQKIYLGIDNLQRLHDMVLKRSVHN